MSNLHLAESLTTPPNQLVCECGSMNLSICVEMPVFVYVKAGEVTQTVVPEPDGGISEGTVRCLSCERFWFLGRI